MDFGQESTIKKLIVLFVLDKIEIPLTEESMVDICHIKNDWIDNYMECKEIIGNLIEVGFIYAVASNLLDERYTISYSGRNCLMHFYQRINEPLREQISDYVKENRIAFKRKQEYISSMDKNSDGSYTVLLKIISPVVNEQIFELKIKAPTRKSALNATSKWREKAHLVYEQAYEMLIDIDS